MVQDFVHHFLRNPAPLKKNKSQGGQAISPAQEDDFLPEDQMFKMPKNLSVQGWERSEKDQNFPGGSVLQELCKKKCSLK